LIQNDSHSENAKCEMRVRIANRRVPEARSRDSGRRHLSASLLGPTEVSCLAAICRTGAVFVVPNEQGELTGWYSGRPMPTPLSALLRLLGLGLIEFAEPQRIIPAPGAAVALSRLPMRSLRAVAELEPA
jgi:hypothetical protein